MAIKQGAVINRIVFINNVRYSDDTVVLAESEESLQALMSILSESSIKMELERIPSKSKSLVLNEIRTKKK